RFAMLRGGFRFVQPLERTVMALVQLPVLGDGDPELVQDVERDPQRLDGSLEDRGERDVENESTLEQQPAGFLRFRETAIGEINVGPSCEPVFSVPRALAVTKKDDLIHGSRSFPRSARRCRVPLRSAAADCTCRPGRCGWPIRS